MVVVELDGETYRGRAIDLRDSPTDASEVAAAIRDDSEAITVRCPAPGPVHSRVGIVRPDRSYPLRAALAATARCLGYRSSRDPELTAVRKELASLNLSQISTASEREALAEVDDVDEPAERVAALRGRIEAARERGESPGGSPVELREAIAELSERHTERAAAEQALERAREKARKARDRRERRLRLQDREHNLQQTARRELAATIEPVFERALDAVPGECVPGDRPGVVRGDETTAALAICRIAPLSAPVVVACDRFPNPGAAAAALAAPTILI